MVWAFLFFMVIIDAEFLEEIKMNAPLNLFIFMIFICFLIPLLFFFFKLKKKDYRLKIQETRLDQINQEISKKKNEIDFARRKLEELKIKLQKENSRIKSEQDKLEEEARRISDDKIFLEQEKNKQQERIRKIAVKFQNEMNKIDRKNEEVENKIREVEGEKEDVELERAKLEAAKKEINDASKQIQNEWQKIRLEKDRLEKRKPELNEKENEIRARELQFVDEREDIDDEKENIKNGWQRTELVKQDNKKRTVELDEREKELNEKERQFEIQRKTLESEKNEVKKEWRKIELEKQDIEKRTSELGEIEKCFKEKERQLKIDGQLLADGNEKIQNEWLQINDEIERLKKFKNEFESEVKRLTQERINLNKEIEKLKKKKRKGIPLTKRSSRRSTSDNPIEPDGHNRKTRIIPELICWQKGRCWHLGIQISRQILEDFDFQIIQDDESLFYNENDENCWVLKSISSVRIKWHEENQIKEKQFGLIENENCFPLLFRLIGKNEKHGKFVKNPSCGAYCAIVPDNWQRDAELSESAPFQPEQFFISGYKVHFFYQRKNSGFSISFIKPDGKKAIRDPKGFRFSLSGNQIPDADDEIGPLFGHELPKIIDSQAWNEISTIIIGEEGEGIGDLRWEIQPDPNSHELDLDQLEKRGEICISKSKRSWFFIRFYDTNDKLVESLDFRNIQGLKKIIIPDHSIIPLPNGHQPVVIKFLHDKICSINIQKNDNDTVIIKHNEEETIATIPANPAWDLTDWEIKDISGKKVKIELLVERIWWNLCDEKNPLTSNNWSDIPLDTPKEYFTSTSQYAISVQFPKVGWIKDIALDFNKIKPRQFKVLATQRYIKIPIREFSDCEEISNPVDHAKLFLWIDKNRLQNEVVIAKIESKRILTPEPKLEPIPFDLNNKPCCNNCDHARRKFKVTWCRRGNWPQQSSIENFEERIAHFKCGEWREA